MLATVQTLWTFTFPVPVNAMSVSTPPTSLSLMKIPVNIFNTLIVRCGGDKLGRESSSDKWSWNDRLCYQAKTAIHFSVAGSTATRCTGKDMRRVLENCESDVNLDGSAKTFLGLTCVPTSHFVSWKCRKGLLITCYSYDSKHCKGNKEFKSVPVWQMGWISTNFPERLYSTNVLIYWYQHLSIWINLPQ